MVTIFGLDMGIYIGGAHNYSIWVLLRPIKDLGEGWTNLQKKNSFMSTNQAINVDPLLENLWFTVCTIFIGRMHNC